MPTIGERLRALGVLDTEEDEEEPQTIGERLQALGVLDKEPIEEEATRVTDPEVIANLKAMAPGDAVTPEDVQAFQEGPARFIPSPLRSVAAGFADAGMGALGVAARGADLVSGRTDADTINRRRQLLGAVQAEIDKQDNIPDIAQQAIRGAISSLDTLAFAAPAGFAGILAAFGADAANTSYTTGKDAGLEGAELAQYTAVNTGIEVGITALFQGGGKLVKGLGGLEELAVAKEAFRGGLRAGLKQLGIGLGSEIAEEEAILLLNAVNDQMALGQEMSAAQIWEDTKQTVATVGLTMGLAKGGISALQRTAPQASSRTAVAKLFGVDRKDVPRSKAEREQLVAEFNAEEAVDGTTEDVAGTLDVEEGIGGRSESQSEKRDSEIAPIRSAEESGSPEGESTAQPSLDVESATGPQVEAVTEPESEVVAEKPKPAPEPNAGRPPEQTRTDTSVDTQLEIAEVIKNDPTEPQPETTTLTQAQILQDRADLLIDGPQSLETQRLVDLNQEALDKGLAADALGKAQVINANPKGESITPVQRIGLRHGAVERKKNILKTRAKVKVLQKNESKNAAEINSLAADINRMQNEFEQISQAEFSAQSQAGLLLRTSQMVLDEGFDVVTVLADARIAKKTELTPEQKEGLEERVDKHEKAEERAAKAKEANAEEAAINHINSNVRRKKKRTMTQKRASRQKNTAKLKQLIELGCVT